ncbi:hypothetical protein [Sulfitobacter geojensis]|uniref:hypothetical protein n=1 Tax=Sulfitobacter geojensis TaxID=1342299 RepID=UPI003B8D9271
MFSGTEIESLNAKYQTRDMQRDAYVKVGAFCFFGTFVAAFVVSNAYGISVHLLVILAASALFGMLAGYLSYRHGVKISARLRSEDRAARQAYKDKKLEEFLKNKAAQSAPDIKNTRQGAEKED